MATPTRGRHSPSTPTSGPITACTMASSSMPPAAPINACATIPIPHAIITRLSTVVMMFSVSRTFRLDLFSPLTT